MFSELEIVAEHMRSFQGRYWIAGGWAIDCHVGRKTRARKDVEIAIDRKDQKFLGQLPNIEKIEYVEGGVIKPWHGEDLSLPIHEIYCHFNGGFVLEVLLNEFDEGFWLYRRNKNITLTKDKFAHFPAAPLPLEVLLLFKSKHCRPCDEQDFAVAFPLLNQQEKTWLRAAIALDNPKHPWLGHLVTL